MRNLLNNSLIFILILFSSTINISSLSANDTMLIDQINRKLENYSLISLDSFFIMANKALELSRVKNYEEGEAKSLNNLGVYFIQKGQFKIAEYYLIDAQSKFCKQHNNKDLAQCLNNIGLIYLKLSYYHKAESLFNESLKIKKILKDSITLKQTLFNLAQVYQSMGNYNKALQLLQLTYENEKKSGDHKSIVVTLITLGELSQIALDKEMALNYYNEALLHAKIANKEEMPGILYHIAQNYFTSNRLDNAYNYAFEAYRLSDSLENKEIFKESAFLLSLIFENKKNHLKALDYLKQYNMVRNLENNEQAISSNDEHNFTTKILENKALSLQEKLSRKQLLLILLILILSSFIIITLLVFGLYKVRKRYYRIMELRKTEKLRYELLNEGQEKERKRIARELHDSLGQLLSTVKLTLTELQDSINFSNKEDAELMAHSVILIDDACVEVRNVSHALMPNVLIRQGLGAAINDMADKLNKTHKIKVNTFLDASDMRFDEKIEIALYRIIQEILNNIIKHSGAENAGIYIVKKDDALVITITDNGKGIDKKEFESSKGIGWENINSRLLMINGNITILPLANNKGTKIILDIKLDEN